MIIKLFEAYIITHSDKRNDSDNYYFETDNFEYKISINEYWDNFFSVAFKAKRTEDYFYDHKIITNGNPYEVIDTVVKVCVDFYKDRINKISEFSNLYKTKINPKNYIKGFCFSFQGDEKKNSQRLLLYKKSFHKFNMETNFYQKDNMYYLEII